MMEDALLIILNFGSCLLITFLTQLKRELMLLSVGIGTACSGYCLIVFSFQVYFIKEERELSSVLP